MEDVAGPVPDSVRNMTDGVNLSGGQGEITHTEVLSDSVLADTLGDHCVTWIDKCGIVRENVV